MIKIVFYICNSVSVFKISSFVPFFIRFHLLSDIMWYLAFFDLLHSVWQSLGPSVLLQMALFHSFLWLSNISLCVCVSHLLYLVILDGHLGPMPKPLTVWITINCGKFWKRFCILSPYLFNFYAEYSMRNAGLEEAQAGIKIARRNISNLKYEDDTTLMAESEKLKSL